MSADREDFTEFDWFGEGRIRETAGNIEGAIEAFGEAVKLNPNFGKAWYYKALLHFQLGQKEDAIACAKRAMDIKPSWEKYLRKNLKWLEF
ncbi:MAG: tetratricopeptide repeat protein [Candidatus Thorarchaeota archaeon]|nr:tetratricopeptide repeat protein [Candidatus Thorarchaeota archaeon]